MKKLLLPILCLIISLSSCNSDDDNPTTVDPLIGEWKLTKYIEKDSSGNIVFEENSDTCDLMDDITYNSNGTGFLTSHSSENNECFLGANITINSWLNNDNGTYTFSGEITEEDVRADAEVGSFTNTIGITFSNDLTIHTTSLEEDQTDLGNGIVTFESVYERQ